VEFMCIERLQDFAGRSEPQERGEHEIEPILDFTVGVFVHLADGIAYQADREFQGSLTSLRLVEESRGHASSDGVQFELRELPFEAKKQAPIG